ncbi:MAG: outer membrane lipoprotein LolB [Uliginosibacterium sp.]|nr:outer membrane lipoprotein LolB [Uliginosibacterium sp.]
MTRLLNSLLSAVLCVSLLACANAPSTPKEVPPRPARETVSSFAINARAVIKQSGKANSLRIMWEHTPDTDNIGFASPLTGMIAELQRDRSGARWISAEGEHYEARNADLLIARLTSEPVPIAALALWVTGQLSMGATDIHRDNSGRLLQAADKGWQIRVLSYETERPEAMPSVMEVESGSLLIRLAFEEYVI